MPHPDRGALRLARLSAFVAACLLLGLGAHAYGGGGLPSRGALAVAAVPVALLGLWFTRVERGVGALLVALGTAQVGLHVLFHLSHGAAAALSVGGGHAMHDPAARLGAVALRTPGVEALLPGPVMLATHLVAVALTALLLGWGDRSLWAWGRRLLPALPTPAGSPALAAAPLPTRSVCPLRGIDLGRLAPVRGPPRPVGLA